MSHAPAIDLSVPEALRRCATTRWACDELLQAAAQRQASSPADPDLPLTILIADISELPPWAEALGAQAVPEALALDRDGDRVRVWGSDRRGLVYALTELADRIRTAPGPDLLPGPFPLTEKPTARVRSMARMFCSETEDMGWFRDRQQWRDYLGMLAANRFNRFSLTLGMGYNYPYHNPWITDVYFYFPYPFLLAVPGYDVRVLELDDEERDLNMDMLRFIGREAARRGLDFQLALWTQRYDFDDVPRAAHRVVGIAEDTLAPYCRDAVTRILTEVPEITGLTFRVHVEGGIAEGDYGFWKEVFAGVAAAGRPVEIDLHGKGLDETAIDLARQSGMPVAASPKYLAEHMGLPYHQSAIRDREYPPETARSEREQLSEGSRKFLRYSYGDLLTCDKDYKVIYRIWPGTQRVLLWADPVLAAGYGRSSMFAGSDGVEWCEPQSFKGRMGTGIAGQRFYHAEPGLATRQDWQKYDYQYRVWGRLIYNPDAPRDSWMRWLKQHCGAAAGACEVGLSHASRILPLITLTHGPSASNNFYWPEIYTNLPLFEGSGPRAYRSDMAGPIRFGNAPSFDSMLFANPREYAELLLEGQPLRRYGPMDVADWLEGLAVSAEDAALEAQRGPGADLPEVGRILPDIRIMAGLGRYFAEKYRAAVWAELFHATRATSLIEPMLAHARRAVAAWESIAEVSRGHYPDDLTFGPQSWLRGSWHERLPEIKAELLDLEALRNFGGTETVPDDDRVTEAVLTLRRDQRVRAAEAQGQLPTRFHPGQPLRIAVHGPSEGAPVLHYRHVNQAERWHSVPMTHAQDGHEAIIPADYTGTRFQLQYFVSLRRDGRQMLMPGLSPELANEPYITALQGGQEV